MTARSTEEAARELRVSEPTLRRWIADGAPVARKGRRGRGCQTLIDPLAIRAWRAAQSADPEAVEHVLRDLAGRVPELVAGAIAEAFRACPSKRDPAGLAWMGAAGWALIVGAFLDLLHERLPDLDEPAIPESVERLRKIAGR